MEQRYLADTNVLIDYLGNKLPASGSEFLISYDFKISAVSKVELLGWHKASSEQIRILEQFISGIEVMDISDQVINEAIRLRQSIKIPLGDSLIAATALVGGLTILTRNLSDFKDIDNLNVLDLHSLD